MPRKGSTPSHVKNKSSARSTNGVPASAVAPSTSANSRRHAPRASTSRVTTYNEDELASAAGSLLGGGGGRMDMDEEVVLVVDDESDEDEDEDEDEEEDKRSLKTTYMKALEAFESGLRKKEQKKIDKSLKEARATFGASMTNAEQRIRAEMGKADRLIAQLAEERPRVIAEEGSRVAEQWAKTFSSQHALAEQFMSDIDQMLRDLEERDGEVLRAMVQALSERKARDKKVYKKFKHAVWSQEQEAVEMARLYEESAKVQVKYFKAAAKA